MNQITTQFIANAPVQNPRLPASLLAERVRDFACTFGDCGVRRDAGRDLWVRAAGRHIIVGRGEDEAFARITPLGADAYGLAFRAPAMASGESIEADATSRSMWAKWGPLLLIDALADVVEHALIGEGATDQSMLCM
jgi:hypothetical protein